MRRAIILAAGLGKRMRSNLPKVLHEICGRSMLSYVVDEVRATGVKDIVVVVSGTVLEAIDPAIYGPVRTVVQAVPQGTGDAVKSALEVLDPHPSGEVLIVNGDMPLMEASLFLRMLDALGTEYAQVTAVARMGSSSQFGRVARDAAGDVARIIETRDCTPDELALDEMNVGMYAFAESALREAILSVTPDNAQKEYYLTDVLALLRGSERRIAAIEIHDTRCVLGVNDRVELAVASRVMNARLCERYMRAGVTIIDPATTYLEPGLTIGVDTTIYPNTMLSRETSIGESCVIGPNTRIERSQIGDRVLVRESVVLDSRVGDDGRIGPYAHLRAESDLAADVRIGNFVELKNSTLASGVRAGHLSYLGDADVGEQTNIGAGTITCNFDGKQKHRTVIGRRVFIGSNSSLIAPIVIADDALTGAGSVVTRDVAEEVRVVGNPARPMTVKQGEASWR